MLKSIILFCLAVHMGSAHWPGHEQEGITRILVRQNTNNTMTARPPAPTTPTFNTFTISTPPTLTSPPSPSSSSLTTQVPSSSTNSPSPPPSTSASPLPSSGTSDLPPSPSTSTSPPTSPSTSDLPPSPSTSTSPLTSSGTSDLAPSPSTSSSPLTSTGTSDLLPSPSTSTSPLTSSGTSDLAPSPSTSTSPLTSTGTSDLLPSPSTSTSPPTGSSTSSSTQPTISSTGRPTSTSASSPSPPTTSATSGSSPKPSSTRTGPTSFPTVDEDSAAPKDARPIKTTHGSFTAIISNNPVILDYSGEVLPISPLLYGHTPAPSSFKYSVLAALAGDDQTKPFGDLLALAPSVFEGLDGGKNYYIFAPTAESVVEFFKDHQAEPNRHVRRKQLVDPHTRQQFVEKPKDAPDIKEKSRTLTTTLVGEIKYVNLGLGEASRVVSNPFDGGVIRICDGFFTLPRALETVFASTNGRLWSTALEKAGILRDLSEKQKATIFTVEDDKLDEASLPGKDELNRLIYNGLLYEPDLSDGNCLGTRGGSLSIIRNGDGMFVNNVRVTKANVIAKNCVIHYLETIPPIETCVPNVTPSAGSRAVIPKVAILGLSVASLVVCLLM